MQIRKELRQWLLIYDQEGTKAQMNVFLNMADRKLAELRDQQVQLSQTIEELEQLRQTTDKLVSG